MGPDMTVLPISGISRGTKISWLLNDTLASHCFLLRCVHFEWRKEFFFVFREKRNIATDLDCLDKAHPLIHFQHS